MDFFDVSVNKWCSGLRRNLNDWEVEDLGRMLGLLDRSKPNPSSRDKWVWTLKKG